MDISQTIVQGGIGVSALIFALYIFNRCMDQMKELSTNVTKVVEEMKAHNEKVIDELRDIVSTMPKNTGENKQ